MFIAKHTTQTTIAPAHIWEVLQDVKNWNTWDPYTESSTLNGPFKEGTTGTLKPKDGPLLQTKLIKIEPLKLIVQETKLLFAKVVVAYAINEVAGKTEVTFQIDIRGPLALIWTLLMKRDMKKKLPVEMEGMLKKAKRLA